MPSIGSRARFISDLLAVPVALSLRHPRSSLRSSYSSSIATPTRWPSRRAFSVMAHPGNDLLSTLQGGGSSTMSFATQSVDVFSMSMGYVDLQPKGGFNRTFLITMRCGFQMVASIPYLATIPEYFAVASEAATMALLRSSGLPIPKVYGYSPVPDNAAETEYIFMEFVRGTCLRGIWFDLGDEVIILISRRLAKLESKMMSIAYPAGGSLYYTKDLEKVAGRPGITLEDERFCIEDNVGALCLFIYT
ncbi:hypothetical protein BGW80DRAFT_1562908 [Lactifluus volemus]|nr:hypothetical protein BGW80DRAFT_1562908 [Lactifluus volemus]